MDPSNLRDEEFDRALRLRLQAVRAGRGECPATEVLTRYSFGDSSAEEAEAVRAHVARCGLCDALLYRMKGFPESPRVRLPAFLRSPILGYALALALVYPAYRGLKPSQPAPPASPPAAAVEAPPGVSLDEVRGTADRRAATVADGHFLIHFALPVKAGRQYRATIRAANGRAVVAGLPIESWDSLGNFTLLCRAADFPPGRYSVEVEELEAGTVRDRKTLTLVR